MTPGTWRHERTLDIDMHVFAVYPLACGLKVKAVLFNRHNKVVYQIKTFKILKAQLKYWKRVHDQY